MDTSRIGVPIVLNDMKRAAGGCPQFAVVSRTYGGAAQSPIVGRCFASDVPALADLAGYFFCFLLVTLGVNLSYISGSVPEYHLSSL